MTTSPESRKRARLAVSIVSLVAVAALGTWYLAQHLDDFKKILEIDFFSFAMLSGLVIFALWLSGLTIIAIVPIFGARLSMWEGFGLSAVNTMANFYFTKAGLAAKGLYLKKMHDFPYTSYVSIVAGTGVIMVLTNGLVGLVSYAFFLQHSSFRYEILLAFAIITFGGVAPFLLPRLSWNPRNRLFERLRRVVDGWEQIKAHRQVVLVIIVIDVLYVIVGAFRLWVSYRALGYPVDLLSCIVISPISTLTMLVSLTPGAVGIRQALVGYGSELLGIGMTEGVVASTIDHAVGTLWVFVFGLTFANWIWARKFKSAEEKGPAV